MKFFVITCALIGCTLAQSQYGSRTGSRRAPIPIQRQQRQYVTEAPVQIQYEPQEAQHPVVTQYKPSAVVQVPIAIQSQTFESQPDGSYTYGFVAENGISANEDSHQKGPVGPEGQAKEVRGSYSYTAPDGTPISVSYVADETGFHATGDHLPVAPAIPEEIRLAIASLPRSEEGQYHEDQ